MLCFDNHDNDVNYDLLSLLMLSLLVWLLLLLLVG